MATPTKRSNSKNQAASLPDNHSPSEAIAHAIVVQYADLTPSVNRILSAELGEAGQLHAITLFRDSLGVVGDPNRNPAVAIEAGRLVSPAE